MCPGIAQMVERLTVVGKKICRNQLVTGSIPVARSMI